MTSRVLALVSEGDVPELHHNELPMSHLMYGVIAFILHGDARLPVVVP